MKTETFELKIKEGNWFVADIIGLGIYELVESGINSNGSTFANVKLKKLFCSGFKWIGHVTNCHPVDVAKWDQFKIIKL